MLFAGLLVVAGLGGCTADVNGRPSATDLDGKARSLPRVVSLDYCADQYVLKLASRKQIAALSPDATENFSYLRVAAEGVPQVRPVAENILALKPDVVVRSYGGGPTISRFLQRAGVTVVQLPWINDLNGKHETSITHAIRLVAEGLNRSEAGETLVTDYQQQLRALTREPGEENLLYMSAAGFTSGSGTLIHQTLSTAGFHNYEHRRGWHPLPLEQLVYEKPDRVAAAFFDRTSNHDAQWSAARHPIARDLRDDGEAVFVDGATTACGAWYITDVIAALQGVDK